MAQDGPAWVQDAPACWVEDARTEMVFENGRIRYEALERAGG